MTSRQHQVSSPGFGIIDSGCGKTLIGKKTLSTYMHMLKDKCNLKPQLKREQSLFRFGDGQEELAETTAVLPISICGRRGQVEAAVISGDAPLLLSRSTMRSLNAALDFAAETISICGSSPQPLTTNSAGQFVINIMDFAGEPSKSTSEALVSECNAQSEESSSDEFPEKPVAQKMNRCHGPEALLDQDVSTK